LSYPEKGAIEYTVLGLGHAPAKANRNRSKQAPGGGEILAHAGTTASSGWIVGRNFSGGHAKCGRGVETIFTWWGQAGRYRKYARPASDPQCWLLLASTYDLEKAGHHSRTLRQAD